MTKPSEWPKLSEDLPSKEPGECQRCRATVPPLTYWQECDENDVAERVFVVLCAPCAKQIIEPHPRLYRELSPNTPMPGAMPICRDCSRRNGMGCFSPLAKFNGGPGLTYEPEGQMVHLCRSPRSKSGWQYLAPCPVTACSGKEATPPNESTGK